jgi:Potato type II proteinase inhibitor family
VRFTENWLRVMPACSEVFRYRDCRTAGTPKITAFCAVCCSGRTACRLSAVEVEAVCVAVCVGEGVIPELRRRGLLQPASTERPPLEV